MHPVIYLVESLASAAGREIVPAGTFPVMTPLPGGSSARLEVYDPSGVLRQLITLSMPVVEIQYAALVPKIGTRHGDYESHTFTHHFKSGTYIRKSVLQSDGRLWKLYPTDDVFGTRAGSIDTSHLIQFVA